MSEPARQFDDVMREAAEADAALLDAVMRRLQTAEGAVFDPSAEALTMRSLARDWRAVVPPSVGLRVYREVLGAALRRQAPVSLHVADTGREVGDLARAHFGFALPMTVHASASMVVQALVDDRRAIGIVPAPRSDGRQPGWWSNLSAPAGKGPRIVSKLPFLRGDGSAVAHPVSYTLASVPVTATGDDTTLVVVFLASDMSRARLAQVLKQTTLEAQIIAMGYDQPERAPSRFLIEASGFLSLADPRLQALKAHHADAIADIAIVGAYANPIVFGSGK